MTVLSLIGWALVLALAIVRTRRELNVRALDNQRVLLDSQAGQLTAFGKRIEQLESLLQMERGEHQRKQNLLERENDVQAREMASLRRQNDEQAGHIDQLRETERDLKKRIAQLEARIERLITRGKVRT